MQGQWKKTFVCICLMIFGSGLFLPPSFAQETAGKTAQSTTNEIQPQPHHLVVTYFHTTSRCPTCYKIENSSGATIHSNFEDELQSGKLVWRVINVDKPLNKHFIKDYQLYSKHLIVSEVKDGKVVRWKDLKKIWMLVRNQNKFENYVKTEISDWLKE